MQLNVTTDYALRVLLCLATEQRPLVAAEISDKIKIPQSYVSVIMLKLKKGGFISSNRGQVGGYCLIRRPEEISMWDVIQVMERAPQIACCNTAEHGCGFQGEECPLQRVYSAAQNGIEDVLKRTTIADLCPEKDVLWNCTRIS
jgi:Rrf2 family protein